MKPLLVLRQLFMRYSDILLKITIFCTSSAFYVVDGKNLLNLYTKFRRLSRRTWGVYLSTHEILFSSFVPIFVHKLPRSFHIQL